MRVFERDKDAEFWVRPGEITWLGSLLGAVRYDSQQEKIKEIKDLLDHIHKNYSDYFNWSKEKNVDIARMFEYRDWSVRNFSHKNRVCRSIYSNFNRDADFTITLHDKGVFLEKYKLQDKSYQVAVYSTQSKINLKNSNVRLKGYIELAKQDYIKAGYTDKYGIIAFYNEDKSLQMLIQISGQDKPIEVVVQWLNYLAIVTASEQQKEQDKNIWDRIKDYLSQFSTKEELQKVWGETQEKTFFPWMNYAISEAKTMDGVKECYDPLFSKGKEYHQQGGHNNFCPCGNTTYTNYCNPNAWCASFANWCLRKSDVAYTRSAGSQTFLNNPDFVQIHEPVFGAIAVFTNLDGNGEFKTSGHVAFVVGRIGNDQILCLGGNQGDMIKVSRYSLKQRREDMLNKLYFRGYYIPRAYLDKLENYKITVGVYNDAKIANQQIINLNINTPENESTR
jgi:uncharacterized protein (TIGR02594 family)